MKSIDKSFFVIVIALLLTIFASPSVLMADDLAKQSQNPLGTIISSPFENNLFFGIGPSDKTTYGLTWKPVYPASLGSWNLINRFIVPVAYSPGQDEDIFLDSTVDVANASIVQLATGSEFGLTDITYSGYLSPKESGSWIWGVGGAFVLPTATSDRYASNKWSAGPAFVALTMPGNWVTGILLQNVWSFAGDEDANDVNKFLFQYFINYNLADGWYLSTTPIITANWEAQSGNQWTVPFGGGVGKLVKHGKLPIDYKLTAYYNVEKPEFAPDWQLQFTIKFLLPKSILGN